MEITGIPSVDAALVEQMRAWLFTCNWKGSPTPIADITAMAPAEVVKAVAVGYPGGVPRFLDDNPDTFVNDDQLTRILAHEHTVLVLQRMVDTAMDDAERRDWQRTLERARADVEAAWTWS